MEALNGRIRMFVLVGALVATGACESPAEIAEGKTSEYTACQRMNAHVTIADMQMQATPPETKPEILRDTAKELRKQADLIRAGTVQKAARTLANDLDTMAGQGKATKVQRVDYSVLAKPCQDAGSTTDWRSRPPLPLESPG